MYKKIREALISLSYHNKKPEKILLGQTFQIGLILRLEINFENLNGAAEMIEGNHSKNCRQKGQNEWS